jgi:hypothetical protein
MLTAKRYRMKATAYGELRKTARSPSEARECQHLEQSYTTLADNAQWLADNRDKANCPGADDDWYGDILRARQDPGQQKNTPGRVGAADPTLSTEVLAKVQQLFDDAGSKGGLLQTATLRGQLMRFLKNHKGDDFR